MKNTTSITRKCPMCGAIYAMGGVDEGNLALANSGIHAIQDLFPDYNPLEREFIKTGYCPECQSLLFGTEYTSDKIRRRDDAGIC